MERYKQRKLTISSKHQDYGDSPLPELRLSGKWFKDLGFVAGSKVTITVREGLILIQPLEI